MDEMLLLLLKKRAHLQPVRITTSELGRMLGMSQQNSSRRLSQLEKSGLVERSKNGVSITKKGFGAAHSLYEELNAALEKRKSEISGKIISGLGEGKYYMSFPEYKKQIKEKLGFGPYEGTLNVKLSGEEATKKAHFLKNSEPVIIKGFRKGERTFGDLFSYPCKIEKIDCALVVPLRTHHPSDIIEIVASVNLKKALVKKDDDEVRIELQ